MKVKRISAAVCSVVMIMGLAGCGLLKDEGSKYFEPAQSSVGSDNVQPTVTSSSAEQSSTEQSKPQNDNSSLGGSSDVTETSNETSESNSKENVSSSNTTESTPVAESIPVAESTPESAPESSSAGLDSALIRPEVKEAIDAYETVMNEYCEFMEKYNKSSDQLSMMNDYLDMMKKYTDYAERFSKINNGSLTDAETAYYVEVQLRVSKKLSETANNM